MGNEVILISTMPTHFFNHGCHFASEFTLNISLFKGSEMFQYYIKIVPTTFARLDGSTFVTNQFSVTRHSKVNSKSWTWSDVDPD